MSTELSKGILDGYLDIACLLDPPLELDRLVASWHEEFTWVRSANFVLSPGAPIPIVAWPGSVIDALTIRALEKAGLAYRIVFASQDHHARYLAVAAGFGVMHLPVRQIAAPLRVANEYYLPLLEKMRVAVAIRPGLDPESAAPAIEVLRALAPEAMMQRATAS
jgi:hypothetical protein